METTVEQQETKTVKQPNNGITSIEHLKGLATEIDRITNVIRARKTELQQAKARRLDDEKNCRRENFLEKALEQGGKIAFDLIIHPDISHGRTGFLDDPGLREQIQHPKEYVDLMTQKFAELLVTHDSNSGASLRAEALQAHIEGFSLEAINLMRTPCKDLTQFLKFLATITSLLTINGIHTFRNFKNMGQVIDGLIGLIGTFISRSAVEKEQDTVELANVQKILDEIHEHISKTLTK